MKLFNKNTSGNIGMIVAWTFVAILLFIIVILYYGQHEAIATTMDGLIEANNDSFMLGEGVPNVSATITLAMWSWAFAFVILVVGIVAFGILYSIKREEDSRRRF